jgi:excisionase family DNA binding protein
VRYKSIVSEVFSDNGKKIQMDYRFQSYQRRRMALQRLAESMKKSYSIDEVAKEFNVSRRTIERLIQRGKLDSFKVGDARRIDATEVERLRGRAHEISAKFSNVDR